MEHLVEGIALLAISGLGWITYKHPLDARKILTPLIYITAGVYVCIMLYYSGAQKGYSSSFMVTAVTVNPSDSSYLSYQNTVLKRTVEDSIRNNISLLIQSSIKRGDSFMFYCYLSAAILVTLFILSRVFEDFRKPKSIG